MQVFSIGIMEVDFIVSIIELCKSSVDDLRALKLSRLFFREI